MSLKKQQHTNTPKKAQKTYKPASRLTSWHTQFLEECLKWDYHTSMFISTPALFPSKSTPEQNEETWEIWPRFAGALSLDLPAVLGPMNPWGRWGCSAHAAAGLVATHTCPYSAPPLCLHLVTVFHTLLFVCFPCVHCQCGHCLLIQIFSPRILKTKQFRFLKNC